MPALTLVRQERFGRRKGDAAHYEDVNASQRNNGRNPEMSCVPFSLPFSLPLKDLIIFEALKFDLRSDVRERRWSVATFPKLDLNIVRQFCSRRTPALFNASLHFYRKFFDELWAIFCEVLCLLEIVFQVKQLKPRFQIWFAFRLGVAPAARV